MKLVLDLGLIIIWFLFLSDLGLIIYIFCFYLIYNCSYFFPISFRTDHVLFLFLYDFGVNIFSFYFYLI